MKSARLVDPDQWRLMCNSPNFKKAGTTIENRVPQILPPRLEGSLVAGEGTMDKDRVVGSAKEVKGEVKQTVGKAVGDAKLEAEGVAERNEGKVQNALGGLKDTIKDAAKEK